jgi:hypothetical protein
MPHLLRLVRLRPSSLTLPTRSTISASCTFTTTPSRLIKEDAHRTPEELEAAKQEQLQEQKEGKGKWKEELASHGESAIAADKDAEKVDDHDKHMEDLQKETAGKSEQEHPEGKA